MTQRNGCRNGAYVLMGAMLVGGSAFAGPGPGVQLDTIRCGRHVIEVGDQSFVLLEKCGDPDFRQVVAVSTLGDEFSVRDGKRRVRLHDHVSLVTESWVYRQGRGRIPKVLTVSGGVLTDIRLMSRLR